MSNLNKINIDDIQPGYTLGHADAAILRDELRELLAYREAQGKVVGWKWRLVDMVSGETSEWRICLLPFSPGGGTGFETESIPLYATPQIPAVPAEKPHTDGLLADGWNACRTAMLKAP